MNQEHEVTQEWITTGGFFPPPCPNLKDILLGFKSFSPAPQKDKPVKKRNRINHGGGKIGAGTCIKCFKFKQAHEFATAHGYTCTECKTKNAAGRAKKLAKQAKIK